MKISKVFPEAVLLDNYQPRIDTVENWRLISGPEDMRYTLTYTVEFEVSQQELAKIAGGTGNE